MPAFAMDLAASHSASALSLNVSSHTSSFIPPIMHVLSTAVLLGSVAVQKVLGRPGSNGLSGVTKRSVDDFINTQTPIALNNLLCNVGPDGCRAFGTSAGAVIASPSTTDPDYYYMWTRDSALVFKNIVDRFTQQYDAGLQRRIEQYISAQVTLQGISNPSGSLSDGSGLGEPKFELTLSQFTGNWGRPQRDGPALRAIALIGYSKWLINNNYQSTVSNIIWPIVRNDLNYVAQYWNQTGFDLWEEVNGSSFFTVANQHRALVEGATLAATLGQSGSTYSSVAPQILCFLQRFWVSGGYIDSNINTNEGRTGKDANSLLASIHTFDPSLGCDASTFQPCSDKALSNLKVVVDSFRSIYGVNKGIPAGSAVAIGRYPEDVYFNGNPWYLATFAAAEQLYDSVYVWKKTGSITVTSTSLAFFQELVPGVAAGTYSSSQSTFTSIINAVSTYADGFLSEAAKYVPADGSLAEQFDRNTGTPLSAVHLTWSYASFLTAAARRAGVVPPSWASSGANSVPSSCSGASVVGSYSRPTATSFPPSQTPKPGVPSGTPFTPIPCATPTSVAVTFHELATTQFGQTIKVAGSAPELGNWSTSAAIALDAVNYATNHPLWIVSVNLEAGDVIEYKYINVGQDGSVTWESDPNHTYTVPAVACVTEVVKEDTWQS
ncbi:GH15 glucamylase with starch binding domain [Trichoderma guizhouense]|uniref:Glucoamylase n=1 Tax=Trichoderma guizhouense TaxID=1491466 RepID=A0A1T3CN22_9HYPO|nr:GH15 glucamylase with starch binding domain [Trichoderma guizhouense]